MKQSMNDAINDGAKSAVMLMAATMLTISFRGLGLDFLMLVSGVALCVSLVHAIGALIKVALIYLEQKNDYE